MQSSKWFGIGLVCLMTGCASNNTPEPCVPINAAPADVRIPIAIDVKLSLDQMVMVNEAADMWRTSTHGLVDFRPTQSYNSDDMNSIMSNQNTSAIIVLDANSAFVKAMDRRFGKEVMAFTMYADPSRTWLVLSRVSNKEFRRTIAHEMGHALMMLDLNDPKSLMFSELNDTFCLTLADAKELCRVRGCDPQQITTCNQ